MNRQIVTTKDQSTTVFVPELDEHYHSIHGAIQEALHVFIDAGLKPAYPKKNISILEIGFGTGLNTWLTLLDVLNKDISIQYSGIEKYPITTKELEALNYEQLVDSPKESAFLKKIHEVAWEDFVSITPNFELKKIKCDIKLFKAKCEYDLIYFDAFAPSAQLNLWTVDIFKNMYAALKNNGVLVTYCVKGDVRRAMIEAGFVVEKIPGPPGKREMARAYKSE